MCFWLMITFEHRGLGRIEAAGPSKPEVVEGLAEPQRWELRASSSAAAGHARP